MAWIGFALACVAGTERAAAQEITPLPSDAITRFVLIPAGLFRMGDTMNDGVSTSETPVHTVSLSEYYIQSTEATKAQWDAVRAWALTRGYTDLPAGGGKGPSHPVQSVSWFEIVKWCNAASERAGLTPCYTVGGAVYRTGNHLPQADYRANGYRLPTEAEWEKASRGGLDGRRYGWGDTISHAQANYFSDATYAFDISPTRGYHPTYAVSAQPYTSPVASFPANGYGLHDMSANVWEVCGDGRRNYTTAAVIDPIGPDFDTRAARGVGWNNFARGSRNAFRGHTNLDTRFNNSGFRPARSFIATAPIFAGSPIVVHLGVGESYAAQLSASGESAPIFSVQSGSLPPGIALAAETGALGGVSTRGGTFSGMFAATNSAGVATQAFTFTVVTSFDHWAEDAGLSGEDAAPTAMPFGDGVPNLVKYAFNLNPAGPDVTILTSGGSAGLPSVTAQPGAAPSTFVIEFIRRRGAGLLYQPQESNDLLGFRPLSGEMAVTEVDDFWERVIIVADASDAPRRFFRIEIVRP